MKTELTDEMIRKSFQDIQTFERVSFVLSVVLCQNEYHYEGQNLSRDN